jgi:hypothetical protein
MRGSKGERGGCRGGAFSVENSIDKLGGTIAVSSPGTGKGKTVTAGLPGEE